MNVEPITLEGRWARLEPLAERHADDLAAVSDDAEIWRYMPASLMSGEQVREWIAETLALQDAGAVLPFAIVERESGRAIGGTRYLDIRPKDRGIEIGWTWLARRAWRTAINSECKYLLLRHAFEALGCIRVQLKTDRHNERSRRAIERIGGQFEGILRQHMILRDGTYRRDSAYYSILDAEWPAVKERLAGGLYGDT
ncbi:MAG: GNAT family N-acetyltransferase [Roseiflexaceae bacterium]